jgi:hypothetical protein
MSSIERCTSQVVQKIRYEPVRGKKQLNAVDNLGIECCEMSGLMSESSLSDISREVLGLVYELVRVVTLWLVIFYVCCIRFWAGMFRIVPLVRAPLDDFARRCVDKFRYLVIRNRFFPRLSSLVPSRKSEVQLVTNRMYSPQEFSGSSPAEGGIISSGLCLLDLSIFSSYKQFINNLCQLWRSGWGISLSRATGDTSFAFFWDLAAEDQPSLIILVSAFIFGALAVIRGMVMSRRTQRSPFVVYYPQKRDGWVWQNQAWIKETPAVLTAEKST